MTDSGSQSPRRSLLPIAAAIALLCASLTPTAAQQTATGSATRGGNADPLAGVIAVATGQFDEQRFQIYGGSVIGRRVLVGVTATF